MRRNRTFRTNRRSSVWFTDKCTASTTKYVKLYRKTTNSKAQVFDAEGCSDLFWELLDKPLLQLASPGKTIVSEPKLPFRVYISSTLKETVTVLELSQNISTQACEEAVQLSTKESVWDKNLKVQSAQCFGSQNCAIPAKNVVNEISRLQSRKREALLRCKLIQQNFAETNVFLVLRQCAPGRIAPNCEKPIAPINNRGTTQIVYRKSHRHHHSLTALLLTTAVHISE